MKAKDLETCFVAPSFVFLGLLCFMFSILSVVGAFVLTPSYIVVSFVFFLLGYTAMRIGVPMAKS